MSQECEIEVTKKTYNRLVSEANKRKVSIEQLLHLMIEAVHEHEREITDPL
jgi:hypothetical protein